MKKVTRKLKISREIIAISRKYPLTNDERSALELLWAEFEDKRLDAELEEIDRLETGSMNPNMFS